MKNNGTVSANWSKGNTMINFRLPFIAFQESGSLVIYCPALDLSGYGATEKEAEESFKISMDEYFKYTLNKKTLFSDLQRLGWKVFKNGKKPLTPPDLSSLLAENENFSRIFNRHSFRKFVKTVSIPA
jgi:hypothetical protein